MSANCAMTSLIAIVTLLPACAAMSPAPRSFRHTSEDVQRLAIGTWTRADASALAADGELLAVDAEYLYLERGRQVTIFPSLCVRRLVMAAYEGDLYPTVIHGISGSLSTVSHGIGLLITLPIWLITTASFSYHQSKVGYLEFEGKGTTSFDMAVARKWARFPQGLPPDYLPTTPEIRELNQHCTAFTTRPSTAADPRGTRP